MRLIRVSAYNILGKQEWFPSHAVSRVALAVRARWLAYERPPKPDSGSGDSKDDPSHRVLELTHGEGADRGCECVGFHAHDPKGHEVPNEVMNNLVKSVRATGSLGVVGVFMPEDPKSSDELAKQGKMAFDFG